VLAAYVFRFPAKHWSPFVLGGAGALVFDPSADFNLKRRFFLRTEYRGVFYNSPTFNIDGLNGLDRFTHRSEPSLGFGYHF
jgi:hypothetical protein